MNADKLIDLVRLEAAVYLLGGTTNNAPDASKEVRDTFENVMEECLHSNHPYIQALDTENG